MPPLLMERMTTDMPVTLAFHFPAGRYHATPWGHHVNEGLIEWPPSPWRLLRALISVGYTSGIWDGTVPPPAACGLFAKLASVLPSYHLPTVIGTHSRHYMPTAKLKDGREDTTLVFDTWARVKTETIVTWAMDMNEEESSMLGNLVERLGYLGRSESWILGRVMPEHETVPQINCFPECQEPSARPGCEQVSLLVPMNADDFKSWRSERVDAVVAKLSLPEGKKLTKKLQNTLQKATEPYPSNLIDCLQKDTNWLRKHGWSQPPGSRRVFYWRQTGAIEVGAPKAKPTKRTSVPVKAMLLSLTNTSRNDHALPSVVRTLPQAELIHQSLVVIAAKNGKPAMVLTGCDEGGHPLKGAHEHAHVNPLDLDDDGHVDHVLIWAPMGLGADAQTAIRALRKTFTKGGHEPLRLALAMSGDLTHLARLSEPYGRKLEQIVAPDGARFWQSLTPFIPPRFIKRRGKNTLKEQINAELRSRGLPDPVSVQQLAPRPTSLRSVHLEQQSVGLVSKDHNLAWSRFRHFILSRRNGPQPPIRCGFAIQIEFEHPIRGPLALGYASHFGLGTFAKLD